MPTRSRDARFLSRNEWTVALALLVLLVLAAILPGLEQPDAYHAFADARVIVGVRNGANVLSNAAFVVAAVTLALGVPRVARLARATRVALYIAAAGLLLTAVGSAYYHLRPDDNTLFWDRLPMTITFAGVVGAGLAQRVSTRAGAAATFALLILGPGTLLYWRAADNLVPYVLLQGGAMLAVLFVALLTPRRGDPFPWWWLIGWYAAAKAAEFLDAPIFALTRGAVSGHTLKHVLAAIAALGLAYPLWRNRAVVLGSG